MSDTIGPRRLTGALAAASIAWNTYSTTLRAGASPESAVSWDALDGTEVRVATGQTILREYGRTLTELARAIHGVDAASPWVAHVASSACTFLWAAGVDTFDDLFWPLMHAPALLAPHALVAALNHDAAAPPTAETPDVRDAARRVADALPGLADALPGLCTWFVAPSWEATMRRALTAHFPAWRCLRHNSEQHVRPPEYSSAHLLHVVLKVAVADADAAGADGRQAAFDRAADVAQFVDLDAATSEQRTALLGLIARIRAGASAPAATFMLHFIRTRRDETARVLDTHMAATMLGAGNPEYGDALYAKDESYNTMARYMHVRAKRAHYEKTGDAEKAAECAAQALALEALLGFT